jgi:acyl-CoA thioester hydrolase
VSSQIFEHAFIVDEKPEDYLRHVNNLRYLEWFIDTAVKHADSLGWGMNACKMIDLAWVAKSHQIEYISPAYQGDRLIIQTWIDKVTPTRITRCYKCKRGEQLIAKASTVWVLVDYNTGKPRALPYRVKEKFSQETLVTSSSEESPGD